jgi:lipoprotein-anchoring transpeptidase ErfK/SrfK
VRRTKYALPNSPARSGRAIVLLLALVVVVGWIWWRHSKTSATRTTTKSATNAPAKVTRGYSAPGRPISDPGRMTESAGPTSSAASSPAPSAPNPAASAVQFPRHVKDVLEAQIALYQLGISSGSLDGGIGSQTRAAIAAYQKDQGLAITGELDAETKTNLEISAPPYTNYTISSNDLARLQPIASTWLGKSQQTALDYETILELVAEKSFSHPSLIRKLNPAINWTNPVPAGTEVVVPNAAYPPAPVKAAWVTIHLNAQTLEAFDSQTNLIAHFPCSIAKRVEKRPIGLLHVQVVAPNPNYTFDPDVFPESEEAKKIGHKLILPPGPNNPVGVAWIGLDRPGYGMHGTPQPEAVGRTESHGCFRLANWNADYLLRLITVGTPVYVVE